jgi:hypothetical protein
VSKVDELKIHDLICSTVLRHVKQMSKKKELLPPEVGVLEKYAKIYGLLMSSARENKRTGFMDDLKPKDLKELTEETLEEDEEDQE